jgi:hypothetical protein
VSDLAVVEATDWRRQNYEYTVARLDQLRFHVQQRTRPADPVVADRRDAAGAVADAIGDRMVDPPAIDQLAGELDLDGFERSVLMLCLGFELDGRFGDIVGPCTVGLALEVLDGANWASFDPRAPLRRSELIDVGAREPMIRAALRLGPDVLTVLTGVGLERPGPLFRLGRLPEDVVESRADAAAYLAAALRSAARRGQRPVVELHGAAREERRLVAQLLADAVGHRLAWVDLADLPHPSEELEHALGLWDRNARLTRTVVLVECEDEDVDPVNAARLRRAVSVLTGPLVVSGPAGIVGAGTDPVVRFECSWPAPEERLALWRAAVRSARRGGRGRLPRRLDAGLAALAERYRLACATIAEISEEATGVSEELADRPVEDAPREPDRRRADPESAEELLASLNRACRRHSRRSLEHLADRVPLDTDEELVLPDQQMQEIDELVSRIDAAYQVNVAWEMRTAGGGGVAALFSGPSGTGKTMAARVVARRTGLDCYRIDLSAMMSKYIGETEKNIRQLFDAADVGGALLLFDEADALFGKRSEVRDSHDRYANVAVAFLLQRIEATTGPAVLTTNMKEAIDPAFVRRIAMIVEFPFPDGDARQRIWSSVFPAATPTEGVDPELLSSLVVNGGTIRNIAVRGAFLAAAESSPVRMPHLLEAARRELRKIGRDLPVEEVAGWV